MQWPPTPVLLPGESHGRRSLVGCSPWGHEESDTTEWLHFQFSLSCIGEGNGDPLQCSCLENPRDGRAWWAAVYGVAQQTRLKRLSSSSSSRTSLPSPATWNSRTHREQPYVVLNINGDASVAPSLSVMSYVPDCSQLRYHLWVLTFVTRF